MGQGNQSGVIKHLKVVESALPGPFGSPLISKREREVRVVLDTAPDLDFVLKLEKIDENIIPKLAMFSLLKEAYLHRLKIEILYFSDEPDNKTVRILSVSLEESP
jgi:hypothetical protein